MSKQISKERIHKVLMESIKALIREDSAEDVTWKGKNYAYYREGVKFCTFCLMGNGRVICGGFDGVKTHEELMLNYWYELTGMEPPQHPYRGCIDFRRAYDDIETYNQRLFNVLHDQIAIQGRVFLTDDGKYVFSCYELLAEDEARSMMERVANHLELPAKACYYVGHYNKLIVPLVS